MERARGRRRPRAAPRRREAPGACGAKPCGAARSRSWVAHARGRGEAARAPGAELSAAAGAKGVARWPRAATRGSWPRAQGSALWGRAEQGRQALVQDSGAVLVGRVGSSVNLCWLLVCSSACFSRGFFRSGDRSKNLESSWAFASQRFAPCGSGGERCRSITARGHARLTAMGAGEGQGRDGGHQRKTVVKCWSAVSGRA